MEVWDCKKMKSPSEEVVGAEKRSRPGSRLMGRREVNVEGVLLLEVSRASCSA